MGHPAVRRAWFAIGLILLATCAATASTFGPYTPEGLRLREQFWLIPSGDPATPAMRAIVLRPPGEARRPLAVIAHPTLDNDAIRAAFPMTPYLALARILVERGYAVVIPIRRGYGATAGVYHEQLGGCADPGFAGPARQGARDLAATVTFLREQPFVAATGLIVAGQAGGALTALAYAATRPAGLTALLLFSTGRGARQTGQTFIQCREDDLIGTVAGFARTIRAGTLMLAAENDRLYPPAIAERLSAAMTGAGAPVRLRVLRPVGATNGHDLLGLFEGPAAWAPAVSGFLTEIAR
jgi:dienelactone hydrolase